MCPIGLYQIAVTLRMKTRGLQVQPDCRQEFCRPVFVRRPPQDEFVALIGRQHPSRFPDANSPASIRPFNAHYVHHGAHSAHRFGAQHRPRRRSSGSARSCRGRPERQMSVKQGIRLSQPDSSGFSNSGTKLAGACCHPLPRPWSVAEYHDASPDCNISCRMRRESTLHAACSDAICPQAVNKAQIPKIAK